MIFDFNNIGIIESAKIELKGLTVITGLNDTGKSFLSKSIFSLIKTINEASNQQKGELSERIQNFCQLAFAFYRQAVILPKEPEKLTMMHPQVVSGEIIRKIQTGISNEEIILELNKYKELLLKDFTDNKLKPNPNNQILQSSRTNIENQYIELVKLINLVDVNNENKYIKFFNDIIVKKLFQNQFNSFNNNTSRISAKEGENELLDIIIKNNITEKFQLFSPIIFKDATLIETPTILQLSRFVFASLALGQPNITRRLIQQRSEIPYHYYDLIDKIFTGANDNSQIFNGIVQEISDVINGHVIFDPADNNFVFRNKNNHKIKGFNIASGIKSFGLLQLLLNSHFIDERSILIIDEPEVHLHPRWEIEYANIIVQLSKSGIPIIISTHSPYFLQALPHFVNKYATNDITKFYFGELLPNKSLSSFKDVTDDLEPIFKALSEPMKNII